MPNLIKEIKNTMVKKGISEDINTQFDFSEEKIELFDKLETPHKPQCKFKAN